RSFLELPKSHGIGSRDSIGNQAAFLNDQVFQVDRHTLLHQYAFYNRHIQIDPIQLDLKVSRVAVERIYIQLNFPTGLLIEPKGHIRKLNSAGYLWRLSKDSTIGKAKNK